MNLILNWIVFYRYSMFEWIIKIYRPGLPLTQECINPVFQVSGGSVPRIVDNLYSMPDCKCLQFHSVKNTHDNSFQITCDWWMSQSSYDWWRPWKKNSLKLSWEFWELPQWIENYLNELHGNPRFFLAPPFP